jgi:sirohydrochlorin ferrochelatase
VVGTDAEVRSAVLEKLNDERHEVRQSALSALAGVVGTDAEVRSAVLEKLNDERHEVRQSALSALARVIGVDAEVRSAVLKRLGDKQNNVRWSALRALAGVVGTDAEVRATVLERLGNEQPGIRVAAVKALTCLFGVSPEVTSAITELLGGPAFEVEFAAVEVIAGAPASTLNSALLARLQPWLAVDAHYYFTAGIRARLASHFGPRAAADSTLRDWLLGQLREPRWSARCGAIFALLHWPGGPPRSSKLSTTSAGWKPTQPS